MNRHDRVPGRANRFGIAAMIGAMLCFVINDALVKYASQSLPAGQLIFVRGVMASAMVLVVATAMGAMAKLREIARGWIAVRAAAEALATLFYLVSLFHLPISTATAINMTTPLIMTVIAAVLFRERIALGLAIATVVGFVGVVFIVQPRTAALDGYALLCLCAAVLLAARDMMTRHVHAAVPTILVTLSTTISVTLLAGAVSVVQGWGPISAREIGILALAAVMLAIAYTLIVSSTRYGDLALVAPFRYSALPFAAVLGYIVWGDIPNLLAWIGIALVISTGVLVLRASRRSRASDPTHD
jgi:drug/metabolite transporter (DMT)-like permease